VQEVIEHGVNGLLVDFFNTAEMADAVVGALEQGKALLPLREAARRHALEHYSLKAGEAAYRDLILAG